MDVCCLIYFLELWLTTIQELGVSKISMKEINAFIPQDQIWQNVTEDFDFK